METQATFSDIQKILAGQGGPRKQQTSAPAQNATTKVPKHATASDIHSILNKPATAQNGATADQIQKLLMAPRKTSFGRMALNAAETLPPVRDAEKLIHSQKGYWGGQAKSLASHYDEAFGKDGKKGKVQKVLRAWKNDPEIKNYWQQSETPLINLDVTRNPDNWTEEAGTAYDYKHYKDMREAENKKKAQHEIRAITYGREIVQHISDFASGLTSPQMVMLEIITAGQAAPAKAIISSAAEAAEVEAGLAAAARGLTGEAAEKVAKDAGKAAARKAAEQYEASLSLKDWTANKALSSLISAGFSYQMLSGVVPGFKQAEAQFKAGDTTGGVGTATDTLLGAVFGTMAGVHALHGAGEIRGQWRNEREVKAALEVGAQETYKKPFDQLSATEKNRVVYEAVSKYGSEDAKKFHRQMQVNGMRPGYGDVIETLEKESMDRFGKGWYDLDADQKAHIALDAEEMWPEVDRKTEEGQLKAKQIEQIIEGVSNEGLSEIGLENFRKRRDASVEKAEATQPGKRGVEVFRPKADVEYEKKAAEYRQWEEQTEQDHAAGKGQSTDQYYYTTYGREPEWAPEKPEGYDQRQQAYAAHLEEQRAEPERRAQKEMRARALAVMTPEDHAYEDAEEKYQDWERRRGPLEAKLAEGKPLTAAEKILLRKPSRKMKPYGYDQRQRGENEPGSWWTSEQARNEANLEEMAADLYPKGKMTGKAKVDLVYDTLSKRKAIGEKLRPEEKAYLEKYEADQAKASAAAGAATPQMTAVHKELDEFAAMINKSLPATYDRIDIVAEEVAAKQEAGEALSNLEQAFQQMYDQREQLEAFEAMGAEGQDGTAKPSTPVPSSQKTKLEKERDAERELELEQGRILREKQGAGEDPAAGQRRIEARQPEVDLQKTIQQTLEQQDGKLVDPETGETLSVVAQYRQITDVLDIVAKELLPDYTGDDRIEVVRQSLDQRKANNDKLTDNEHFFLRQVEERNRQQRLLGEKMPEIQKAIEAAEDARQGTRAKGLIDEVHNLRRANDIVRTLSGRTATSPEQAAAFADQVAKAQEVAEHYRRKVDVAQTAIASGPSTLWEPQGRANIRQGNATQIHLPDDPNGTGIPAHYGRMRLRDITGRLTESPDSEASAAFDLNQHLSRDTFAQAGPPVVLSDGTLVSDPKSLWELEEALRGSGRREVGRGIDIALAGYGRNLVLEHGIDVDNPEILVRLVDQDPLTNQDLARLRSDLTRKPEPLETTLSTTGILQPEVLDEFVTKLAETGKPAEQLLRTAYGPELVEKVLGKETRERLTDREGKLTAEGRRLIKRTLVQRALGVPVPTVPPAVLDLLMPHLGALSRLADGDPAWRLGNYLADALYDIADAQSAAPALDRIGTSANALIDKYYRPLNVEGGEKAGFSAPAAPNRITESLARLLSRGRGDALSQYAMALKLRMNFGPDTIFFGDTQVSAFNRDVASKVEMKVDVLDFGQQEAVQPAERKAEEEASKPVEPTPEERVQEQNPTKVPEQIERQQAEAAVVEEVKAGKVTPETLHKFFMSHPKLKTWADDLVHFFDKVVPKATGLSLADFLERAMLGHRLVADELTDKGDNAAGMINFVNSSQGFLELTRHANASTVIHEFFHLMQPYLKAEDLAVLEAYGNKQVQSKFGHWPIPDPANPQLTDSKFKNELAEVLARTWERYVATGEVPEGTDNRVKLIFKRLKVALRGWYDIVKTGGKDEFRKKKSRLKQLPSEVKIKLTPEVERVFESWFREDDARKPITEPPVAPEAPKTPEMTTVAPVAAAPQPGPTATPTKVSEPPARAAAAVVDARAAAIEKQKAANEALDQVAKQVEEFGLEDKSPAKMTPAEKTLYERYKATAKAAADADQEVARLGSELAGKPLELPPDWGKFESSIDDEVKFEASPTLTDRQNKSRLALKAEAQKMLAAGLRDYEDDKADISGLPKDKQRIVEAYQKAIDEMVATDSEELPSDRLAKSAELQRWAGNTKVVGDDGKPALVHHQTWTEIEGAFDRQYAARKFKRDMEGADTVGVWFSDHSDLGKYGPRNVDAYLKIENPLVMEDTGSAKEERAFYKFHEMVKQEGGATKFREKLLREGYDGIHFKDSWIDIDKANTWLALEPDQIRIEKQSITKPKMIEDAEKFKAEQARLRDARQGKPTTLTPPPDGVFPGMEEAVAANAESAQQVKADELTDHMNRPAESIEGNAGRMEMFSPLFADTEANPQGGLFGGDFFAKLEKKPPVPVETLAPGDVGNVATSELQVDPKRFQYKMNTGAEGTTNLLKGLEWDEEGSGILSVWRDPADGKTYVVNGHHRFELARDNKVQSLTVRMLDAKDAAEARSAGALINIREGRGTATDAAKYFRDTGTTMETLRQRGISLGEATAMKGLALSRLDQRIFDEVVSGRISEDRAAAIANATDVPEQQEAILALVEKAEDKGKTVTNATINELARMVRGAGVRISTQINLFGEQEMRASVALEKAEISSYIRKAIADEIKTFSVVEKTKSAQVLKDAGNRIASRKNTEKLLAAQQAEEAYDAWSTRTGRIDEILNAAANALAEGKENPNALKTRVYKEVRAALSELIPGGDGQGEQERATAVPGGGSIEEPPAEQKADEAAAEVAEPPAEKPAQTPVKTKKPTKAEQKQAEAYKALADHYAPGNVIWNNYWRGYDKVLEFDHDPTGKRGWSVKVIHTDKDGNVLPHEQPRTHSTVPDKGDKVVIRAAKESGDKLAGKQKYTLQFSKGDEHFERQVNATREGLEEIAAKLKPDYSVRVLSDGGYVAKRDAGSTAMSWWDADKQAYGPAGPDTEKLGQASKTLQRELGPNAAEAILKRAQLKAQLQDAARQRAQSLDDTNFWTEQRWHPDTTRAGRELARQEWEKAYAEYVSSGRLHREAKWDLTKTPSPRIGEVRQDAQGRTTLWLGKDAMWMLQWVHNPTMMTAFQDMRGASYAKAEIPRLLKQLDRHFGTGMYADKLPQLKALIEKADSESGQEGLTVIGVKGDSIRRIVDTAREELNHAWQRAKSANGEVGSHLPADMFLWLNEAVHPAVHEYLDRNGYNNDPVEHVIEAAAKLMSGKYKELGISEKEAGWFLQQYFDAVEKEHGTGAFVTLERVMGAARRLKEEKLNADKWLSPKLPDKDALGGAQEGRGSGDRGGLADNERLGLANQTREAGEEDRGNEAPANLSVLTPEESKSELVAADGDLQSHMAQARVKEFGSVEEARHWLIETARGDQYAQTFHGSQIREMPDGKALVLYAPVDSNKLYQAAEAEPTADDLDLKALREVRAQLEVILRSPSFRKIASAEEIARKEAFLTRANERLGDRKPAIQAPPKPDAQGKPRGVESTFPEEAKRAGTDQRRAAADDHRGVSDPGGVPRVAAGADGPGGAGEAGRAGLSAGGDRGTESVRGGRTGRGGTGGGEPVDEALPFVRMKGPTRPRGRAIPPEAEWKAQIKDLNIPAGTPAPTVTIREDIARVYSEYAGQLQQVEVAASGLEQHDGVIIASPTGGGKTFISLGLMKQLRKPKDRQLVVTKNRSIITQRDGWKDAAKLYFSTDLQAVPGRATLKAGQLESGVYYTTFAQLTRMPELAGIKWDMVVFDESAEARRWWDSSQGEATKRLSDAAKKAAYVSAAPYHSALEMGYMTKLGIWEAGQFDDWVKELGARKGKNKFKSSDKDPDEVWTKHGSNPKVLMAVRDQLIRRGQFATQGMSMKGHTTDIALVETTEHQRQQLKGIDEAFLLAEKYYEKNGQKRRALRARALGAMFKKNYVERLKLPQMIELAKTARKQGWSVLMFSENKAAVKNLWKYMDAPNRDSIDENNPLGKIRTLLPELPDVHEELQKALGEDQLGNYSGKAGAFRTKVAEAFRSGIKPYLYATYGAGGVGVSFHDDSNGGVRPKLAIHLGLPWSGMMFNQANGRLWRYKTKSNVHSIFLVGDTVPEVDLILNKVMPRLNSIHAAVRGLDGEDPLVKSMRTLSAAEAYAYDLGFKAKYDMGAFDRWEGKVPIRDWTHAKAGMPSAEEAKGKGMTYPKTSGQNGFQGKLYQEAEESQPGVPDRLMSVEEKQAMHDADEMLEDFVDGKPVPELGPEADDVDAGDRKIIADNVKPIVQQKVADRGTADANATARRVARNAFAGVRAANDAGQAVAITDAKDGEPGWEMKGKVPEEPPEKPTPRSIRTWMATLSGMESIKSMTKQIGMPEIGRRIEKMHLNYHAAKNNWAGQFTADWLKIKKDNRLTKEDVRKVWMVKEGLQASTDPRIAKAVQELTKVMNAIRKQAADLGVNLNDYDADGRPVKIPYEDIADNPNYMPHIFDYSEKIKLTDPSGEQHVFTLKQLLGDQELPQIKRDRIIGAIAHEKKVSRRQVEDWIEGKKRRTPLAGNIERARTADLPFYRMDDGALIRYFSGVGEVFARTEHYGQGLEKLDATIAQIPDRTVAKNVNNIMQDALAPEPWSESAAKFYSFWTTGAVLTKMTFSMAKVPFHLVHGGLVMEQFRPMLKAMVQSAANYKEIKQRAIMTGALLDGMNAQMNMEFASKMKLSHMVLEKTGFNWLFQLDRIIGSQMSRNWMEDYLLPQLVKKGKNSAHVRDLLTNTLLIPEKSIDDAVARGRWTEQDLQHGASALTNKVFFTSDSTEMPYLSRMRSRESPMMDKAAIALRVASTLKSFEFKTAMLLKKQLIDEARAGNWRPWIPFILAYPLAGAAIRATSAGMHAAVGDDRSLNKLEQQVEELFDDPTIAKAAQFWLDSVGASTAQTWLSHAIDVLFFPPKEKRRKQYQRGKLWEDELKELAGPYGDVLELGKTLIAMAGSAEDDMTSEQEDALSTFMKHKGKESLDLAGEIVPAARPVVPWLEEQMGLTKPKYQMAPPP